MATMMMQRLQAAGSKSSTPAYTDQSILALAGKLGSLARLVSQTEAQSQGTDPKLATMKAQVRDLLGRHEYLLTAKPATISLTTWSAYQRAIREARGAVAGVKAPMLTSIRERLRSIVKPSMPLVPVAPATTGVKVTPTFVKPAATIVPPQMATPTISMPSAPAVDPLLVSEVAGLLHELAAEASYPDPEVYTPAKVEITEVMGLPEVSPLLTLSAAPFGVPEDVWMDFVDAADVAQTALDSIPIGFDTPSIDLELAPPPAPSPAPSNGEPVQPPVTVAEPTALQRATTYARENPLTVGLAAALAGVAVWQGVKYYREHRG